MHSEMSFKIGDNMNKNQTIRGRWTQKINGELYNNLKTV